MFGLDHLTFGVILTLIGATLLGLLPVLLRFLPRRSKPSALEDFQPTAVTDVSPNENAVLLVQPGGRLIYINNQARQWFGIGDNETPNLERMSGVHVLQMLF